VAAVFQPVAGLVFVLDGVLIGAGDARYLAWTGLVNLAAFAPLAFGVVWWADGSGADVPGALALAALTATFAIGYLAARAITLSLRARGRAWMVTGAPA
jgi:Na+-driven multidrug efflux pump